MGAAARIYTLIGGGSTGLTAGLAAEYFCYCYCDSKGRVPNVTIPGGLIVEERCGALVGCWGISGTISGSLLFRDAREGCLNDSCRSKLVGAASGYGLI